MAPERLEILPAATTCVRCASDLRRPSRPARRRPVFRCTGGLRGLDSSSAPAAVVDVLRPRIGALVSGPQYVQASWRGAGRERSARVGTPADQLRERLDDPGLVAVDLLVERFDLHSGQGCRSGTSPLPSRTG
ncbi:MULTISPECIES: hypothetical protein [Streptomyces]|uniref:hypothetical protein n=1 Tax=Streptomyces TaxID=1883 RepID=UPI00099BC281